MAKNIEDEKMAVERPIVAKTAVDLQRLKLLKLMKNPDKVLQLPERPKTKNTPAVPEFVRNVMGSSAGAGSGEFHVYRHLRRKEYARQKFIQEKSKKELLDVEYRRRIEENKLLANQITAKKRARRLKKKQKKRESMKTEKDDLDANKDNNNSSGMDDDNEEDESNSDLVSPESHPGETA